MACRSLRTRLAAFGAVLLATGTLTAGCGQLRSVDSRAMVTGVALDAGPKPGSVRVMLQWYHVSNPAAASGNSPSVLLASREAPGAGVAAAVAAIQADTDRQISFGETQVVLVSDRLARLGVARYLDYFVRKASISQVAQVVVIHGSASTFLKEGEKSGTAFAIYEYMATARSVSSSMVPIPMWRFLGLAYSSREAAWAPLMELKGQHFAGAGTALFQGDRMVGSLSLRQTVAFSWVRHVSALGDIEASLPDGAPLALRVRGASAHRSIDSRGMGHIDLSLTAEIQEGAGVHLSSSGQAPVEAIAAHAALAEVRSMVEAAQRAGSDVLDLGEWQRERSAHVTADWPSSFRRLPITLRVTVHVQGGGREV